jgi:hypothetical protein
MRFIGLDILFIVAATGYHYVSVYYYCNAINESLFFLPNENCMV